MARIFPFSFLAEERQRLEEQARLEEEERLKVARAERERQREEEKVRFQQVMEVLNQELLLKTEALDSWKAENWKKMKVYRERLCAAM